MVDIQLQRAAIRARELGRQELAQELSEHRGLLLTEAHKVLLTAQFNESVLDRGFDLASEYVGRAFLSALTCIRWTRAGHQRLAVMICGLSSHPMFRAKPSALIETAPYTSAQLPPSSLLPRQAVCRWSSPVPPAYGLAYGPAQRL